MKTRPVIVQEQKLYRYWLLRLSFVCWRLTDHSLFCYTAHDTVGESVKVSDSRRTAEDVMPQDATTQAIDTQQGEYVTVAKI